MTFTGHDVDAAIRRVADALDAGAESLGELDRTVGDGDLGITARKIAAALRELPTMASTQDLGADLMRAGMAINKVASSSFGTLCSGAIISAGKCVRGNATLGLGDLVTMLEAADQALQERGKAKPGDKTVIDVVHPAALELRAGVASGLTAGALAAHVMAAARKGRDDVTPLRNTIGRAGWIGERTEGVIDPGTQAGVLIFEGLTNQPSDRSG